MKEDNRYLTNFNTMAIPLGLKLGKFFMKGLNNIKLLPVVDMWMPGDMSKYVKSNKFS